MRDVETIKAALLQHKIELKDKFKVKTIGVFGSYVRGEQKLSSDLDVLVEFDEPMGLFEFMKLENYLSDLLGVKVDLVSKKALKPHRRTHSAGSYDDLRNRDIRDYLQDITCRKTKMKTRHLLK